MLAKCKTEGVTSARLVLLAEQQVQDKGGTETKAKALACDA